MTPIIILWRKRVGVSEKVNPWEVVHGAGARDLVRFLGYPNDEIDVVVGELLYATKDAQL